MGETLSYVGWLVVVILAILGGLLIVILVRRWAATTPDSEPLTLDQLRELHAQGKVTDEEYRVIRTTLLAKMGVRDAGEPHAPQSQAGPLGTPGDS